MAERMAARRFWLNVPRGFLWGVLAVVLLYFVWLVLIAGRIVVIRRRTQFIDPVVWVWVGLGVFGLALLLGIFAAIPTRGREARRDEAPLEAIPAAAARYEAPPPAPSAASTRRGRGDVELRVANEDYKGKRVLELSTPPKSDHKGAVYAKAYVPVDDAYVLRIEDLVADRRDVAS